jgi:hypothetical protein
MKRVLTGFIILLYIISFAGCDSGTGSLTEGQKIAVKNSIKYIKNSSFTAKSRIDTKIIEITNVTEGHRKAVRNNGSIVPEDKVDLTDWIIRIGSTSDHDFAFIVCDSSTYEVIGYIPID